MFHNTSLSNQCRNEEEEISNFILECYTVYMSRVAIFDYLI